MASFLFLIQGVLRLFQNVRFWFAAYPLPPLARTAIIHVLLPIRSWIGHPWRRQAPWGQRLTSRAHHSHPFAFRASLSLAASCCLTHPSTASTASAGVFLRLSSNAVNWTVLSKQDGISSSTCRSSSGVSLRNLPLNPRPFPSSREGFSFLFPGEPQGAAPSRATVGELCIWGVNILGVLWGVSSPPAGESGLADGGGSGAVGMWRIQGFALDSQTGAL